MREKEKAREGRQKESERREKESEEEGGEGTRQGARWSPTWSGWFKRCNRKELLKMAGICHKNFAFVTDDP